MTGAEHLTFASAGPSGVHYARCEPCMYGQCSGGWHSWAGAEDVEHALKTGQADPSGKVCACHCVTDGETDETLRAAIEALIAGRAYGNVSVAALLDALEASPAPTMQATS